MFIPWCVLGLTPMCVRNRSADHHLCPRGRFKGILKKKVLQSNETIAYDDVVQSPPRVCKVLFFCVCIRVQLHIFTCGDRIHDRLFDKETSEFGVVCFDRVLTAAHFDRGGSRSIHDPSSEGQQLADPVRPNVWGGVDRDGVTQTLDVCPVCTIRVCGGTPDCRVPSVYLDINHPAPRRDAPELPRTAVSHTNG